MAASEEKQVMVVGIDESQPSLYALEWTLNRFFAPCAPNPPFELLIIHAKTSATYAVRSAGPAMGEILPFVEEDLKKIAAKVVETAREMCTRKFVNNVSVEVIEGDPRNVLCEVVEKHNASILVVGSNGYGAIKRAVLGSVSDYCAHHAHCTVMIVKRPQMKE